VIQQLLSGGYVQTLKQNSNDNRCIAVVAAMAFDMPVKEVEEIMGGEPPYSDFDFCHFAFLRGDICGLGVLPTNFFKMIDVSDSASVGDTPEFLVSPENPEDINGETVCRFDFKLSDYPALVIVEDEAGTGKDHAIYWDTKHVFDPNPQTQNDRPLRSYRIRRWYPIFNGGH
jgi:hypothetical protein